MIFNLPTLPPPLLERCLALSEHLYAMKSGSGKLELSPSHFFFSVNHSPGTKETGNQNPNPLNPVKRKKSPSDLRRNAVRKKKFLENKNLVVSPQISPGTSSHSSSTVIPSSNTEEPPTPSSLIPPSNMNAPPSPNMNSDNTDDQNQDLPETNMEVEGQSPLIPHNVIEIPENIDVETLPPVVSPISSPSQSPEEETDIRETITIGDWPEDFSTMVKNNNRSIDVTAIISASDFKSALASLKRTLKKCNLRNIEPRKLDEVPLKLEKSSQDSFAFEFTIVLKNLKSTFSNIKRNWIEVQQSQLIGFLFRRFFFKT